MEEEEEIVVVCVVINERVDFPKTTRPSVAQSRENQLVAYTAQTIGMVAFCKFMRSFGGPERSTCAPMSRFALAALCVACLRAHRHLAQSSDLRLCSVGTERARARAGAGAGVGPDDALNCALCVYVLVGVCI